MANPGSVHDLHGTAWKKTPFRWVKHLRPKLTDDLLPLSWPIEALRELGSTGEIGGYNIP